MRVFEIHRWRRFTSRAGLLVVGLGTIVACSGGGGAGEDPVAMMPGSAGLGTSGAGFGSAGLVAGAAASSSAGSGAAGGAPAADGGVAAGAGAAGAGTPDAASGGRGPDAADGGRSGAGAAGNAGASAGSSGRPSGGSGTSAGSSGSSAAGGAAAGSGGPSAPAGLTPVYRIPLRVHVGMSELTEAELAPILAEVNAIWLAQAGVCFEIEVTASETNRSDGFDFRYTAGQIPGASGSNGVYQGAHSIWSIDAPRLNAVMNPVMHPAARTTAHELGHALGLAHENPPPSNDCASPCHCVELGDDCDEYLMRSGTKGFQLSKPEVETARGRAMRLAASDRAPAACGVPVFMP